MHFSVADTGIGIALEKQTDIFNAFTQADGTITRRYGGSGLGLSISKKLVEMMGGHIWVQSELKQGSSFHFTAPLTAEAPPERSEREARAASCASPALRDPVEVREPVPQLRSPAAAVVAGKALPQPRPLKILLAEDNPVNQKVAVRLLSHQGHSIQIASSGRQALDILEDARFDVVLMDVQMPDLDGFEATRMIRRREQKKGGHIPIIAMTACAMIGDREKCLEAGMDDYISKPIAPPDLFEKLTHIAHSPDPDRPWTNLRREIPLHPCACSISPAAAPPYLMSFCAPFSPPLL